jgi:hypothetical protein
VTPPRYTVESKGLSGWIVRDRSDPFGHEQPRFEGSEQECRAVAQALRSGRKAREVPEASVWQERLMDLVEAVVGLSARDPQDLAREAVRSLHLGGVCQRCDLVYLGDLPERCEQCEEELAA